MLENFLLSSVECKSTSTTEKKWKKSVDTFDKTSNRPLLYLIENIVLQGSRSLLYLPPKINEKQYFAAYVPATQAPEQWQSAKFGGPTDADVQLWQEKICVHQRGLSGRCCTKTQPWSQGRHGSN